MSYLESVINSNFFVNKVFTETLNSSSRLLVVDDDKDILFILKYLLEKRGYIVDSAVSGTNALPFLAENKYDLVISDIVMPHLNGKQLLTVCQNKFENTPVIFLTGQPDFNDAVDLIKQGAADYICKPFAKDELLKKIEQVIKKTRVKNEENTTNDYINNIDGYKVIRHIGSGTYGDVYLVEKKNRKYAMKIIRKFTGNDSPSAFKKKFKTEFISMLKLEHPGILKVYQYSFLEEEQNPYIIMEYAEKGSFGEYFKAKHSMQEKIDICTQLFEAVHYLHLNGIIHRDIKPENILLNAKGKIKLGDFGTAKLTDLAVTKTSTVIGTPAYMAPEAFFSADELDAKADLFSLGSVSYELFTNQKPFSGKSWKEVMKKVSSERPINPQKIDPEIPDWIVHLLAGLLAKKPQNRFANAQAVLEFIHCKADESQDLTLKDKISFFFSNKFQVWQ